LRTGENCGGPLDEKSRPADPLQPAVSGASGSAFGRINKTETIA
jgi:hypothetical protein